MEYRVATAEELPVLAVMRWHFAEELETPPQSLEEFTPVFLAWAQEVAATHTPFLAADDTAIGMAWLARVPRSPGPGPVHRLGGDLQTVYVAPTHRNCGVGAALVSAVLRHAWDQGMTSVTVSSSQRAVPLYQRLGFTGLPPHLRLDHLAPSELITR